MNVYGQTLFISKSGISGSDGQILNYGTCVILSKYLLLSPRAAVIDTEWASLKDFHKNSQFTNLNIFSGDAERPIVTNFSGRLEALLSASKKLGGQESELSASYDLAMEFEALPRIKLLLLFNDREGNFPASCSILFQRQAEDYLDPESLIMVGIALTRKLKSLAENQ